MSERLRIVSLWSVRCGLVCRSRAVFWLRFSLGSLSRFFSSLDLRLACSSCTPCSMRTGHPLVGSPCSERSCACQALSSSLRQAILIRGSPCPQPGCRWNHPARRTSPPCHRQSTSPLPSVSGLRTTSPPPAKRSLSPHPHPLLARHRAASQPPPPAVRTPSACLLVAVLSFQGGDQTPLLPPELRTSRGPRLRAASVAT